MESKARGSDSNPAKNKEANDESAKLTDDKVPDEKLDFYSEKFDPLLALQCKRLQPPVHDARVFDNLAMFDSYLKQMRKGGADAERAGKPKPGSSKTQDDRVMAFQRRFEPHQMPVKSTKVRKEIHTVLTRMPTHASSEGVFGVLEKARTQRLQIKVTIRHSHGVRGVCIAHLTTFDKYWNMTLKSVEEYWIRKRKQRVPAIGAPSAKHNFGKFFPKETTINAERLANDASVELRTLAKMLQSNEYGLNHKNSQLCHRHVNELLVRGEQVVFIAIAQGRQS